VLILLIWLQKGAQMVNFKVRLHNCPSQNVSDEYKPRRLNFLQSGRIYLSPHQPGWPRQRPNPLKSRLCTIHWRT
jgi:hypothetical protein